LSSQVKLIVFMFITSMMVLLAKGLLCSCCPSS
jgi:hypothetical protein